MSNPEVAILKLPDELLLEIAKDVDAIGLHGLSLTCHRMQPIAQEALIRNSTVSPMHVWKLVETLQTHPGLATALTHLRLGQITYEQALDMMEVSEAHRVQADHSSCCDIIPGLYLQADKLARQDTQTQVDDFYSAGMVVLVALAKGLHTISTGTSSIDIVPIIEPLSHKDDEFTSSWYKQARSQLEARLEELNVIIDPWRYRPGLAMSAGASYPPSFMDLSRFGRLKRLVIPHEKTDYVCSDQPSAPANWIDPAGVLPHSLESICLTGIGDLDVAWFAKLLGGISAHPNLLKVEMQFHCNLTSTAWCMRESRHGGRKILALLRGLKTSNVFMTTTFGNARFANGRVVQSQTYTNGDLFPALEKCLTITYDELEKDAEMLAALGYSARPS
jgi:hypothetical protein